MHYGGERNCGTPTDDGNNGTGLRRTRLEGTEALDDAAQCISIRKYIHREPLVLMPAYVESGRGGSAYMASPSIGRRHERVPGGVETARTVKISGVFCGMKYAREECGRWCGQKGADAFSLWICV